MGRGVFSPVYVDDLVDGVRAATRDAGAGQVFTIGGGVGVDLPEFRALLPHARQGLLGPLVLLNARRARPYLGRRRERARATCMESEINPVAVRYSTRSGTYHREGPPPAGLRTGGGPGGGHDQRPRSAC